MYLSLKLHRENDKASLFQVEYHDYLTYLIAG